MVIHELIQFIEDNSLYLDEELTVHCMALFIGVEDIHDAEKADKQALLNNYRQMRMDALRMIADDSGATEINRLFKAINKPTIDGPIIRYLRTFRKNVEQSD